MNELLYSILNTTGHDINIMKAAQNKEFPFVVFQPITNTLENCSGGLTGLEEVNYQIDVYGVSYEEIKSMMNDVITAIAADEIGSYFYTVSDTNEDDGKNYRSRLDVKLWSN